MAVRKLNNPRGMSYEMTAKVEGVSIRRRYRTKKEANDAHAAVCNAGATGKFIPPSRARTTVAAYGAHWLATRAVGPSTYDSYEGYLRRKINPALGNRPLNSLRRSDIQQFVKALDETGLSARSVQQAYRVLAMVLREAVRDRYLDESPCYKIKTRIPDPRELATFTQHELDALISAVPEQHRLAVLLTATTGLRQGELLGLTVERIDFLGRKLLVRQQLQTRRGQGPQLVPMLKTRASRRDVPIPPFVIEQLSAHIAAHGLGRTDLMFPNNKGGPWRKNAFNAAVWKPSLQRANLPAGYGMHSLRHTYATRLLSEGVPVHVVQKRLGHASITETVDTYGHLLPEAHEQTNDVLERAFRAGPSPNGGRLAGVAN